MQILAINTTARNACITGDLATADRLLTQEINTDSNDYNSYANRSFVMARKADWDRALDDALKSIKIQPSLMGCISKGIALCGKRQFQDAMKAFDLAFMFVDADLNKTRLLLLIKAIALFNANQHEEAILRVQELATTHPNANTLACNIVEAYLHVQVGMNALDDARHNEAAGHFTAAVNTIDFTSVSAIHSKYDIFVVIFGWDLKSLWLTAHQNWCRSLFLAGRLAEALKSYKHMMDESDKATKASCLDWSAAFKQDYSALHAAKGDDALAAGNYDKAIELYSAAIDLDLATDVVFANRSKARSGKMLWDDALLDAQMVIKLTPSSYVGYQLEHAALHGAQRYDEAIDAFQTMLSKLENAPDTETTKLHQQYVNPSEAERAIQETIKAQLDDAPHRLLNTFTGRLCNREVHIDAFKTSTEYKELLSSTLVHVDLRMERIQDVVETYFRYVMLSHRWEGKEPLLHDIQGKVVYDLDPVGGIAKLQSFCATARDMGYRWTWIDTCCIDQTNNVEVQQSVNSMFIWYRHSALTIIYLSDVPPSSQPGALASSIWNTRGWTVQEFLAPKFVLFYQKDWSLYLDDRSPNHKDSLAIMQEMGDATGIDAQALVTFRPGMQHAREKLQWVSARVTTWQEDIAYSLFGIFGVNLPVIYGEKKQKALGRLLQEVIAQSGDISALDWVGQSSEFNSCLPADITSYKAPPYTPPSRSEDEIQTSISSLRHVMAVDFVLKIYSLLDNLNAPRFGNCRLHLPCIAFRVTAVKRSRAQDQEIYEVKADGLHDLLITTEDKLIQFSSPRPTMQTLFLVRPWNRYLDLPDFVESSGLVELPDVADDTQSEEDYWSAPESPLLGFFEMGLGEYMVILHLTATTIQGSMAL
ncbi:HET-domain-containing protein [Suillus weaverae]|nr:HET-domain-containing protein [Suillus weaverae]